MVLSMGRKLHNVFAFGSLTDRNFLRKLLKKDIKTEPAELENYEKVKIKNMKYPFAVKGKNGGIRGKLLIGLTEDDLRRIDEWEKTPENYYKKKKIKVKTKRGVKDAIAYTTTKKSLKGELSE